jgi:hypothetical protein
VLEWFDFDASDLAPVVTLIEGLPVDDGALVVAVEPVGSDAPSFLDRLLHRSGDRSPVAAQVYKFHSRDEGDHYVLQFSYTKGHRFHVQAAVPSWARLDGETEKSASLTAPISVPAVDVAAFIADTFKALEPGCGSTWRTVETDAAHADLGIGPP